MTILLWLLIAAAAADSVPSSLIVPQAKKEVSIEEIGLRQLLVIHRVYVDRLTGGETAAQMRDMLVSSLEGTKLFVITENQERADAFLRGAAEDLVFTDVHNTSEGINARSNLGTSRSSRSNYAAGSSESINGGLGIGENESSHIEERKHEAVAAVRLVNKDGDVIWSTTQESQGGKFRRASTDVADRITKKLIEDFERARKLPAVSPAASGTATH
jgi:hypothetical protein